jgi:phage host-nuclease inhibitor protein Gam
MAKSKTTTKSTLLKIEDVDDSLKNIGYINARIKAAEAVMNEQQLTIQQRYEETTRTDREEKLRLEKEIELYCMSNRDAFGNSKLMRLNFGEVAFRLSTASLRTLKGYTWDSVMRMLKKLNMTQYIRTKEEVDKEALKAQLTDTKDFAQIGLTLTQSESFYYEVFEHKIV